MAISTFDVAGWYVHTQRRLYRGQITPLVKWVRGRVLDVASNYGRFSRLSDSTVSLDVERRFLVYGRELGNIKRPVVGSAWSLPFRTGSFDTVVAMGIVDHIPPEQMPKFLDEVTRVAEGGRVIVQVTSPFSPFAATHLKAYDAGNHPYSPLRLIRDLRRRGWRAIGCTSSGLAGLMFFLPHTVNSFLPWAVHITSVFVPEASGMKAEPI